jgi:hypothetical protein
MWFSNSYCPPKSASGPRRNRRNHPSLGLALYLPELLDYLAVRRIGEENDARDSPASRTLLNSLNAIISAMRAAKNWHFRESVIGLYGADKLNMGEGGLVGAGASQARRRLVILGPLLPDRTSAHGSRVEPQRHSFSR